LLKLQWWSSLDESTPAAEPIGTNFFEQYGQVREFCGDDEVKDVQHEVIVRTSPSYIKLYCRNEDTVAAKTADAVVTIEELR